MEAYEHQVGGHVNGGDDGPAAMLRLGASNIMKAVQGGERGQRELQFYQRVFADDASDTLRELRPFLPAFHGTREVGGATYMVLEDLCAGAGPHPSVLDLKMGMLTYGIDAAPEKIEKESSKYPHQRELGFRLVGMKVYDAEEGGYVNYDKDFGYALTPDSVPGALESFFVRVGKHNLEGHIHRLEQLLRWFEAQTELVFRASSLLFVDGQDGRHDVRLIDFAHSRPSEGRDEEYMHGLRVLLGLLRGIANGNSSSKVMSTE